MTSRFSNRGSGHDRSAITLPLKTDGAGEHRGAPPQAPPHPLWRRALPVVAATAVTEALTATVFQQTRPAAPALVSRFVVPFADGQQRTVTSRTALAISPDGSRIAAGGWGGRVAASGAGAWV